MIDLYGTDPSNAELLASAEAKQARRVAECRRGKCRRHHKCGVRPPRPCDVRALHPLTEDERRAITLVLRAYLEQRVREIDERQMKEQEAAELRAKAERRRARRRGELVD